MTKSEYALTSAVWKQGVTILASVVGAAGPKMPTVRSLKHTFVVFTRVKKGKKGRVADSTRGTETGCGLAQGLLSGQGLESGFVRSGLRPKVGAKG